MVPPRGILPPLPAPPHPVRHVTIHRRSPRPTCPPHTGQVDEAPPLSSEALRTALLSAVSPGMWHSLLLTIFLRGSSSGDFHLAFPPGRSHSAGWTTDVGTLPAAECVCSKSGFRTWGHNPRTGVGTNSTGPCSERWSTETAWASWNCCPCTASVQ